ncbi:MAG: DoxX family membrane protein [Gemmatimonadota bacterium]|nr:DoxX family membrane protein [Gemmatimonadota bacterium]
MPQRDQNRTAVLPDLSNIQLTALLLLRIAIGWHFLYEGVVKLINPGWSSASYLAESKWLFSGLFNWIISNPAVLEAVDLLNIWGLILIGLGLIFGCFTRLACIAGILLLLLYYIANPSLVEISSKMHAEGSYLLIDKNLVELFALGVLALFPSGMFYGLDRLIMRKKVKDIKTGSVEEKTAEEQDTPREPDMDVSLGRREILKNLIGLPVSGAFAWAALKKRNWESFEEKHLLTALETAPEATTGATIKTFRFSSLKNLQGQIPYGHIGDLKLSRLFLGGNLIGGWAHARDLIYVSKLVKAYHSDQKVFDTFRMAEQCGINTILTNPVLARVINKYWRMEKGKIQYISDCAYKGDVMLGIKVSIDSGAHACYVQGGIADELVEEGKTDTIGEAVELIRRNGVPAGVGAHSLNTVKECVAAGITPDFWVKTLHHIDYWSARPEEKEHDNIWCTEPEETIRFMNGIEQPWIAFKILAAGAIDPKVGFPYALKNGADFICVGMYDFQIVDDVNLALNILSSDLGRERPWRA